MLQEEVQQDVDQEDILGEVVLVVIVVVFLIEDAGEKILHERVLDHAVDQGDQHEQVVKFV